MTKILGLSGKKGSGKTTASNWIIGQQMCAIDMVSWVKIDNNGQLVVPAVVNDELTEGIFDPISPNPDVQAMLSQWIWPVVKLYSFADPLKNMVMSVFGLSYENVNGTNTQKDAPTKYTWDMFNKFLTQKTRQEVKKTGVWDTPMSGRQILQVIGSDIFRRIYNDVWVDACLNQVFIDGPELAVITDCRFPNEVQGIQKAGGKVIRFTRSPYDDDDTHNSETELDDYDGFDFVLDNEHMDILEQNEAMNKVLLDWKFNTWEWSLQ